MAWAGQMAASQLAMEHAQLQELSAKWREPPIMPLMGDGERQLSDIISSLEHIASRDSIRAGRTWIEANVGAAHAIAGNLMKRLNVLSSCAHRLHVLFLLHDVLQTESAKPEPGRPLIAAFKPYLVWMLRPAYQASQANDPDGDDSVKILKLLSLWEERGILSVPEASEVKVLTTAASLPTAAVIPGAGLGGGVVPLGGMPQVVRPPQSLLGALQQGQAPNAFGAFGGMIRPGLHPGVLGALPGQVALNPETVPVGVMSSMLKQVSRTAKDRHTAFVPYKPLDPRFTPQGLPPVPTPSERLMQRLKEYYDTIGSDRFGEATKDDTTVARKRVFSEGNLPKAAETKDVPRKCSRSRSRSGPRFVAACADPID